MNERMIEHWAFIALAVLKAEEAIKGEWFPKIRAAKKEEQKDIADQYLRALAIEILSHAEEKEGNR